MGKWQHLTSEILQKGWKLLFALTCLSNMHTDTQSTRKHQNIRKKYIFYCYNLICKVVLVKKIKISTYQDNNCTRTPWLFTQLFTKIMEQLICMLLTLVRFLFLRLPVAPGAEKDGWQSSSCGGSAARKQDISCSQQPAQGPRSPHLSQDHRQRHLLSSKAPGSSGHAVRSVSPLNFTLAEVVQILCVWGMTDG